MTSLVEIENLHVDFSLREGVVRAVNGVTLAIPHDTTVGIVGESGCGKSITAKAMMQILPPRARIAAGRILLAPRADAPAGEPVDLAQLPADGDRIRQIRGADIAMIFQEPMTSFSPVHTIGNQICESILLHQKRNHREAREIAIEMLRRVQIPSPEKRIDAYPHELSGGLRQRCMIAMALACHPRLLIADEPTTALDVTIQAQILNLIEQLQRDLQMSVMMITHDLGVIAETASTVAVMYLGRIVEYAGVDGIFNRPLHPYTRGLMEAVPRVGGTPKERLASIPGTVPDPFSVPRGCPFHPRCASAMKGVCDAEAVPRLAEAAPGHQVACYLYPACGAAPAAVAGRE